MSSSNKTTAARIKAHEGRIEKPRARRREGNAANYSIDGRTFACESCKRGHRVSKCTHALQRPVHMTNDPGRPSSDQKRYCDCPRQCSCTKKNCRCDRTCNCTQRMYMLVYVPFEKASEDTKKRDGEWRIDREVITDLRGKELSEEEIHQRMKRKERQTTHVVESGSDTDTTQPSTASHPSTTPPDHLEPLISDTKSRGTSNCCKHKAAIATSASAVDETEPVSRPSSTRPQCNCGSSCACAFCLDHPNNNVSQKIARGHAAAYFAEQNLLTGQDWLGMRNLLHTGSGSCMGTNPQFAMLNNPNPSPTELLDAFGPETSSRNGYFLSYPLTPPTLSHIDNLATGSLLGAQEASASLLGYDVNNLSFSLSPLAPTLTDNPIELPTVGTPQPNLSSVSLGNAGNWGIGDASTSNLLETAGDSFSDLTWLNPGDDADAWLTINALMGSGQHNRDAVTSEGDQLISGLLPNDQLALDFASYQSDPLAYDISQTSHRHDASPKYFNFNSPKSTTILRPCSSLSHEYSVHDHQNPIEPRSSLAHSPPLF